MRILFILLLPIMTMVGCGIHSSNTDKSEDAERVSIDGNTNNITSDDTETSNDKDQKRGKAAAESNDNNNADEETSQRTSESNEQQYNKKQTTADKYIKRLDDLEEQLKPLVEKSQKGSQEKMDEAVDELYERWDVALNEVYNALERKLSNKDMKVLRKEQRKWIKKRDRYADKEAKEWEGGSLYSFALTEAKKEFTKDRCYELVEDYMN